MLWAREGGEEQSAEAKGPFGLGSDLRAGLAGEGAGCGSREARRQHYSEPGEVADASQRRSLRTAAETATELG